MTKDYSVVIHEMDTQQWIDYKRVKRNLTDAQLLCGLAGPKKRAAILPVLQKYGITWNELRMRSRKNLFVLARKEACYRLRKEGLSYCAIGRVFDLDHSTVMFAVRSWEGKNEKASESYTLAVARDAAVRKHDNSTARLARPRLIPYVNGSSVST